MSAYLAAGCDDLSAYNRSFTGSIVNGNFVRSCFPASTTATLRFDPESAVARVGDGGASEVNRLTTGDGTFERTLLEPVPALAHDQLSELDFPGPRRFRNFILLARPQSGPLQGHDATVFVSLLEQGGVELRILGRTAVGTQPCPTEGELTVDAGPAGERSAPRAREYFGVFKLK